MKTTKLTIAAVLALTTLMVSCKKEDPIEPANKNLGDAPECSFCPSSSMEPDSVTGLVHETYAEQVSFFHYGNEEFVALPQSRTTNGYYGYQEGMAIAFNMAELPLACVSNKVTFAHARYASNTNENPSLVNVKFPTTPLIVTVPDSLGFHLAPYGYTVQHFFQPGIVNQNPVDNFVGVVDSIIITGPEFETVTVGANLFESELRSICISHQ